MNWPAIPSSIIYWVSRRSIPATSQHAVFALERAEIARAYFELAEYQTARTEFDHVKQSPATPDSARATVDEYLALIDRATTVSPYSGFVSFSAGWDSNIKLRDRRRQPGHSVPC